MCCIHGICILAPNANVSANLIFHPVHICLFHFSLVSYYTNWFGVYQFTGIITAPFVGLPMDWKPKKKQDEETDMGFIAGYVLTSFVALTLNILVLVPVLPVQVIAASDHLFL